VNDKGEVFPSSINDKQNGVLVCTECHPLFDSKDKHIRLGKDGTILFDDYSLSKKKYVNLKNSKAKVLFAAKIDIHSGYPSSKFLEWALQQKKTGRTGVVRKLSFESDEESDEDPPKKKQKKNDSNKIKSNKKRKSTELSSSSLPSSSSPIVLTKKAKSSTVGTPPLPVVSNPSPPLPPIKRSNWHSDQHSTPIVTSTHFPLLTASNIVDGIEMGGWLSYSRTSARKNFRDAWRNTRRLVDGSVQFRLPEGGWQGI
jgi:hypothetical protein